jgi:putative transposase
MMPLNESRAPIAVRDSPEQNGMIERVIRTLKDQCVHRHRFETLQHASRVIGDWIRFYNNERPH